MTFLKDAPSTDVYYSFVEYINGLMSTRVHPEKLIEPRNFHTHVVSNNPLQIYFIGGNEYNDYDGTIEIWEMIWDHDPAFYPAVIKVAHSGAIGRIFLVSKKLLEVSVLLDTGQT